MVTKTLAHALAILIASNTSAFCSEPVLGERQSFEVSKHSWQLDLDPFLTLGIYKGRSSSPIATYDLADCHFCDGEDDNCETDGIVEVSFVVQPEEPIVAVACHIGAHSQRFQIFAPWRNDTDAVFSVTGAYYVAYQIRSANVSVEYDAKGENDSFETLVEIWP
ncbi:MAG: hypothetical protein ABJX32_13960 [Tateyamaria sp.]|uniref:hypothetical protein n=1 Tax=Alphaproteobacteria TaxID=28211 RepID=UPI00329A7B1E